MKLINTICRSCKQLKKIVDGKELRKFRQEEKMSLRELGGKIGLTAAYLCDIEFNRRQAPRVLVNFWKVRGK